MHDHSCRAPSGVDMGSRSCDGCSRWLSTSQVNDGRDYCCGECRERNTRRTR